MHTIICAISKILELQRGTFFGNNLAMLHTDANNLQAWADALAVTQTTYQNAEKLKAQTPIIIVTVLPFWIHHLIHLHTHTHTHTHLTALFPELPITAGTRKVKPIWILLKQKTVSGSDIS